MIRIKEESGGRKERIFPASAELRTTFCYMFLKLKWVSCFPVVNSTEVCQKLKLPTFLEQEVT